MSSRIQTSSTHNATMLAAFTYKHIHTRSCLFLLYTGTVLIHVEGMLDHFWFKQKKHFQLQYLQWTRNIIITILLISPFSHDICNILQFHAIFPHFSMVFPIWKAHHPHPSPSSRPPPATSWPCRTCWTVATAPRSHWVRQRKRRRRCRRPATRTRPSGPGSSRWRSASLGDPMMDLWWFMVDSWWIYRDL